MSKTVLDSTKRPIQRFWGLIKLDRKEIIQIYSYGLLSGLVSLSLPLGLQAIINFIQGGQITMAWIVLVILVIGGIATNGFIQIQQIKIVENIQRSVYVRSAFEFAYRIPKVKMEVLETEYMPEMVNRFFDTLTIQKGLPKILIDFSLAIFTIFFSFIVLGTYNVLFVIIGVILILFLWAIYVVTGQKGLNTSLVESKKKYLTAHWLEEIGRTYKSFKINAHNELHLDKTDQIVDQYLTARENHFKILIQQFSSFVGTKVFLYAGLLVAGSILVFNEQMNIGQFVAAEILIALIVSSIEKILAIIETIYDVLTGLDKIGHITDLPLDQDDGAFELQWGYKGVAIDAKNLKFKYGNQIENAINGVDFSIKPGDNVMISGSAGSGKTTLLKLLAGLYSSYRGELVLDDIPMRNYKRDRLLNRIGSYFYSNHLFGGTIYENITLGSTIDDNWLIEILEVLDLNHFIAKLPKGLDTTIETEGKRFSKNIIQKLLIARAIVHKPKLVLLDEPLTNVDQENRSKIIDFIMDSRHGWTVIVATEYPHWKTRCDAVINLAKS